MKKENVSKLVDTVEYVSECMKVGCDALRGYANNDKKVIEQPIIEKTLEENLGRVGKSIFAYIKSLYTKEEDKNEGS